MAQQSKTLQPGESKTVSFEVTPTVAKTYQVSVDGLGGSFVAEAAAALTGEIALIRMWYEPLKSWGTVWASPDFSMQLISGEIPFNGEIELNPLWINRSEAYIVGHIDLVVTYPDGTSRTLLATAGQDKEGNGANVLFEPFTSSQEGTYSVEVTLSSGDQVLDSVTFSLTAVQKIGITGITVNPTSLTTTRGEYETSLGLGFWGDPFTISITFKNPFDFDVWVKPDFAFGKLTGGPLEFVEGNLQGFDAEKLLYFRLLLNTEYIQGDYSYTTAWQQMYDARGTNAGSNMAFVYDPDGVPRAGDERWLKIPAGGSKAIVKDSHLSGDLQVKALQCVLCGEIITGSVEAHYASNHPGVEITCWSWGGLSGCYFTDGSGDAVTSVNVPAEGIVGLHDLCVVAWRAMYFVYDPGCGQTRVGGKVVTINWRLEELDPFAATVPNMVSIT